MDGETPILPVGLTHHCRSGVESGHNWTRPRIRSAYATAKMARDGREHWSKLRHGVNGV